MSMTPCERLDTAWILMAPTPYKGFCMHIDLIYNNLCSPSSAEGRPTMLPLHGAHEPRSLHSTRGVPKTPIDPLFLGKRLFSIARFLVFAFVVLRHSLLYSPGWPQTRDLPQTVQMLRLELWATTFSSANLSIFFMLHPLPCCGFCPALPSNGDC